MQLNTLIQDLPITLSPGAGGVELTGLTDDSRSVKPGFLFIARPAPGNDAARDALRFVPQAIEAGAVAVLLPKGVSLEVPDDRAVLHAKPGTPVDQRLAGRLADRFYGHPAKQLKLIGVTGTNGKTTTATITKHLLESTGHKCGLIGTVELDTGSAQGPVPATLTTPGAIQLTELLAEMVANGCASCVMEVSSHALHQGRADHVRFAAAAFTNLTQDHLDYHGSMPAYADAKAILFESLDQDAVAVLNMDDPASQRMTESCDASRMNTAVGVHTHADCLASPVVLSAGSSQATFIGPWGDFTATLPMPGLHNLSNALQATALAFVAGGLAVEQLKQGIETCPPVPGRLEPVGPDWPAPQASSLNHQAPTVLVDYAHTPDALTNVGKSLRELTDAAGGKLITVFGCGGDRDRAKRPLMAKAAQQHADIVVLTSDNPRTEDPKQILDDAAAGFGIGDQKQHIISDRAEAIRFAIGFADANDTVLIAGKGHEDYQVIGTKKHHFDDREQAAAALRMRSSDDTGDVK